MRLPRREMGDMSSRRIQRKPISFEESAKHQWLFRSFDDLLLDLHEWIVRMPDISAVCGVPRSGVIVASMLATLMNLPIVTVDALQRGDLTWRPSCSKRLSFQSGKILIVDDTLWSGGTLDEVQKSLPEEIRRNCLFGVAYVNTANRDLVDTFAFEVTSIKHCFAWNYLRDIHARNVLTDMDGVLCEDWKGDINDGDKENYIRWLENVTPRIRPIYPVLGIVTGRVASNRTATENWLQQNFVAYRNLVMPFPSNASRIGQCVGTRKSQVYLSYPEASLFIESNFQQAEIIFQQTKRPVLCTDTLEMFQ